MLWKFRKAEPKQEKDIKEDELFESDLEKATGGFKNRKDQIIDEVHKFERLLEGETDPRVRESYKNEIDKLNKELHELEISNGLGM